MFSFVERQEILSIFSFSDKQLDAYINEGLPHFVFGSSFRFSPLEVTRFLLEKFPYTLEISGDIDIISSEDFNFENFISEESVLSSFNLSFDELAIFCYSNNIRHFQVNKLRFFEKKDFFNATQKNHTFLEIEKATKKIAIETSENENTLSSSTVTKEKTNLLNSISSSLELDVETNNVSKMNTSENIIPTCTPNNTTNTNPVSVEFVNPPQKSSSFKTSPPGEAFINKTFYPTEKVRFPIGAITFPCFITDASLNSEDETYSCGITILESPEKRGYISFTGSSETSIYYLELFALYRAFLMIEDLNISNCTVLTDQINFVSDWNNSLQGNTLNNLEKMSDSFKMIECFKRLKQDKTRNVHLIHIGDSKLHLFDKLFAEGYLNSHNICKSKTPSLNDSNISFDLQKEKFFARKDFISLVKKEPLRKLRLRLLGNSNGKGHVFAIDDLSNNSSTKKRFKNPSKSSLHATLVFASSFVKLNKNSSIEIALSSIEQARLEAICERKFLTSEENTIKKHFLSLVKSKVSFVADVPNFANTYSLM